VAKTVCTDNEELYKNILKPRIKVGNDFVIQVSNNFQVNTVVQLPTMYKIAPSSFKFKA